MHRLAVTVALVAGCSHAAPPPPPPPPIAPPVTPPATVTTVEPPPANSAQWSVMHANAGGCVAAARIKCPADHRDCMPPRAVPYPCPGGIPDDEMGIGSSVTIYATTSGCELRWGAKPPRSVKCPTPPAPSPPEVEPKQWAVMTSNSGGCVAAQRIKCPADKPDCMPPRATQYPCPDGIPADELGISVLRVIIYTTPEGCQLHWTPADGSTKPMRPVPCPP